MMANQKATELKIDEIAKKCMELNEDKTFNQEKYTCLYEGIKDEKIALALISMHSGLDYLFEHMNYKSIHGGHYNALQTRSLLALIAFIKQIEKLFDKIGYTLILDDDYSNLIQNIKPYLISCGGGQIPENTCPIDIKDTSAIFTLSNKNEIVSVENIKKITSEEAKKLVAKCKDKIAIGDYSGAITNSRSLVESVIIQMYQNLTGKSMDSKGKLHVDWSILSKEMNLHPEDQPNEDLRQVLGGFISIMNGLSGARNKMGDGHSVPYKAERHHALLLVNTASIIADFLFDTCKHQQELKEKAEDNLSVPSNKAS